MANGFTDPNAGRYHGKDPAVRRAIAELQRQMREMREDPVVKIVDLTAIVGTYKGVPVAGRTTATGLAGSTMNHWGMRTEPTNRAYLVINTLESPTNSASAIRIGTVLCGSRRLNANGQDTIFVTYDLAAATSGTDGIDTDPDGEGGGPGTTPGGTPPDPTGGTGGGPDPTGGGGGPLGGGPDGSCPLEKVVLLAGCANPSENGSYVLTWNPPGQEWLYNGPNGQLVLKAATPGIWVINGTFGSGPYELDSAVTCPPNGLYPGSAGSTANVS